MEIIKEWLSAICAVSLIAAILGAITPSGTPSKVMRMCLAFLLLIVLISPIRKIDFSEFAELSAESESVMNEKIESVTRENEKISNEIIENSLVEYICNQTGIKAEEIKISYEENEVESVILYTQNSKVMNVLQEELEIKRERIIIKAREE